MNEYLKIFIKDCIFTKLRYNLITNNHQYNLYIKNNYLPSCAIILINNYIEKNILEELIEDYNKLKYNTCNICNINICSCDLCNSLIYKSDNIMCKSCYNSNTNNSSIIIYRYIDEIKNYVENYKNMNTIIENIINYLHENKNKYTSLQKILDKTI
jgi:hypothetical protein